MADSTNLLEIVKIMKRQFGKKKCGNYHKALLLFEQIIKNIKTVDNMVLYV